jgi:GH35 family endo-1,4-beta-xylanase
MLTMATTGYLASPRSKLLINEYHIVEGRTDLECYIGLINLLKQRNLIDGIGVQGHGLENVSPLLLNPVWTAWEGWGCQYRCPK